MTQDLQQSYLAGPTAEPLLEQTIAELFDQTAEQYADNDALIVVHQGIHWSYREYQRQVTLFAAGLLAIGIEPGDRVGIWAPNCYEWCLTQFATAKIGAILVCVNPAYRSYELEYVLNKVECKALVTAEKFKDTNYLGILQQLAPELDGCAPGQLESAALPHLKSVIRMGDQASAGMYNFDDVCARADEQLITRVGDIQAALSYDEAITIQFTSGTTGSPKGATLTHYNILNNGKIVGDGMRLTAADRLCIPVPLYHCFGMVMGNLACISHGSTAVFPAEAFEPLATLQAVEAQKCTALHGVPTMFIAELDCPEFATFDLSSLRTGIMAGAPCPREIMNRVIEDLHMRDVLIAYGQTETSPVNHMTRADDPVEKRVGSVGQPGPQLEIKIVDEAGAVVPVGEKGEICCRGYAVMKGYWNDPEQTAATIDGDNWLHSGDLGIMDREGYVQVVGRIKDMIIRGGENVYPAEVEEFLYTHPKIQDVQVFGVPDQRLGEQICAWITPRAGCQLNEEEIRGFCRDRITYFKIPHYIKFVDSFPMTVTGKIQKFKMRETMIAELEL
ncbi:MAG: AMP-binding protein [Gammaproteobacteria bacterium]|nr:AMP-binding protein [Gammaproteobacteria bacterium]